MADEVQRYLRGRDAETLEQGLALIPLTEEDWDRIGEALAADQESADSLDWFMATVLRAVGFADSFTGSVAFIEVEGDEQSSVVLANRAVTAAFPTATGGPDGPVNCALRALGAKRGDHRDECSATGIPVPCSMP
ncbi:hypothetical protein [Streptomyces sp. NPDC001978]|uniref:hypothetical protein n=1 Tax=Streptomyces sp. NPDC001978 TaxID=3364627 RepID=UPI00369D2E33